MVDGENIQIGPAATTRMACSEPEGVMEQEAQYLAALETAATYRIDGPNMEMRTAEGSIAATFIEAGYVPPEIQNLLEDATYPSEFTKDGTAPLTNGEYSEAAAEGSATQTRVMLTDYIALGQIDDQYVAAVILVTDPGGSGTFYDLVLMGFENGEAYPLASTSLGDRVQINSINITLDGIIVIDMITHGDDDPMCCPTKHVIQTYALQNGELVQTSSETVEG